MPIELKGRYIRERIKSPKDFHKGTLRTLKVGEHRIIVGCPKRKKGKSVRYVEGYRCPVGTEIQAILHPVTCKKAWKLRKSR